MVFFLTVLVYPPSPVTALEWVAYDEMVRSLLRKPLPSAEVVVVDVDERSLAELGQWPWPRYRIAELIDRTSALGARSIALDFLLSEPDRLSLKEVGALYGRDRGVALNLSGLPDEALDNDRLLADAVARRQVALSGDLRFGEAAPEAAAACGKPLSVVLRALPGTGGAPPVARGSGMVCPIPELAAAASFVAAANALPDQDGKVRRVPLVLRCEERWTPGLALGALLAALGERQVVLTYSAAGVVGLRVGQTNIPTDSRGNLLLPFRARPAERLRHVSAADVLKGRVEPERFRGMIVFFGSSASGLQDIHATPVMRAFPGIDLHALAADAMLRQDFFVEPGWSRSGQAVVVILTGLLVCGLVAWTPITVSACGAAAAAVGLTLGCWSVFNRWGVYWSPIPGLSMLLVGFALLAVVRLRREEKRKKQLKQSFERYVSAQIVDQILHSSRPVNLSGERQAVTILMSDIRGFTSLSERMVPEELVQYLNSYFAAMIDIILASEGTLDKFMGDAILALFGAPVSHDDDALRAVKTALAMQDKLRELNARWATLSQPGIRIGIGISTGEVIVGNIGSAKRLEYTAIGPDVNYAQRIEELTKELPADILVNATTYEQIKDHVDADRFGPLAIRGREEPIFVYGIRGLKN